MDRFSYPKYFKEEIRDGFPENSELQELIEQDIMNVPIALWRLDEEDKDVRDMHLYLHDKWAHIVERHYERLEYEWRKKSHIS